MKSFIALLAIIILMSSTAFAQTSGVVTSLAGKVITSTTLEAVGVTDSLIVRGFSARGLANNINSLTVQYTVASINTNVVVALEASHDGTGWYNLDEEGNTTISSDDTYAFEVGNTSSKLYYRFKFVSESGGTDATIVVKWIFGG